MQPHHEFQTHMPVGNEEQQICDLGFDMTEACAGAVIVRQASFAGDLRACYALGGGSRLAFLAINE
jgi:hypothetical protein